MTVYKGILLLQEDPLTISAWYGNNYFSRVSCNVKLFSLVLTK